MLSISELRITCYNVNGLGRNIKRGPENRRKTKIDQAEISEILKNNEIIFLLETWLKDEKEISDNSVKEFKSYGTYRKLRVVNRGNGGILCFIKCSIQEGVSYEDSESDDLLWIKLDKNYFGINEDLYICGVYISPDENNAAVYEHLHKKPFEILHEECNKYENKGHIALLGDFNARIADNNCFPTTHLHNTGPAGNNFLLPTIMRKERISADDKTNQNGPHLTELCCVENLYILNGRCFGDQQGKYTSNQRKGSSVIDYALVNSSLLSGVRKFEVCNMTTISDHSPIKLTVDCNAIPTIKNNSKPTFPPQDKLIWDENKNKQFSCLLKTPEFAQKLHQIQLTANRGDVIKSVASFENTLITAASRISQFKRPKLVTNHEKIKLSQTCLLQRKTCHQLLKDFENARGAERTRRGQIYYDYRKTYRQQVKHEKDEHQKSTINNIEKLAGSGNSRAAWKELKKLKKQFQDQHNKRCHNG